MEELEALKVVDDDHSIPCSCSLSLGKFCEVEASSRECLGSCNHTTWEVAVDVREGEVLRAALKVTARTVVVDTTAVIAVAVGPEHASKPYGKMMHATDLGKQMQSTLLGR